MARPRKDEGGKSALERLEDAYWLLLEQEDYNGMTIGALSRTASVNHNTFYYYFDNIEDMSRKLFQRNLLDQFGQKIVEIALGKADAGLSELIKDKDTLLRFKRIKLMASSGSPMLVELMREQLVAAWVSFCDTSIDEIDFADRLDLAYISHGVVGMIGSLPNGYDLREVATVFDRELGKGVIGTFQRLIKKYGASTEPLTFHTTP